jgi:Rv2258c-like winged HTH domain
MTAHTDLDAREALAERLVDDTTRALEILIVSLGLDLGLYQALADLGPATELEIATATGVAPRYAREWLEQQATAGYVACPDPAPPPEQRRYQLPPGHAEVLLDTDSPYHTAPLAIILAGVAKVLPQLLTAYRSGGVPYAAYGPAMRQGIAALNRPMFLHDSPAPGCPRCPTSSSGCGRPHQPECSTWAAALAPPRSRWPTPTHAPRFRVDLDGSRRI